MKKADRRITPGSGNVFLDLGFPPHEAAVMLLRCELAEALRKWMVREGLTQAQAAKRLGVAQPRISEIARDSEIARNQVDKLSLDYLVGLCSKAGAGSPQSLHQSASALSLRLLPRHPTERQAPPYPA